MADFRDQLNAYGARNDPAMARSTNANEYADLPNPRRAQEIVDEARRRLAANGGKASMLPAMIHKVTQEFAQRDRQQGSRSDGYVQPNNMEAYIDKVLQMSGMVDAPNVQMSTGGGGGGDETEGAPVGEVERGGPLPDAEPNPANDEAAPDEDSLMEEFAALAAIGGTAYAAYKLYQKYGKKVDADGRVIVDDPTNDGGDPRMASAVDEMIDTVDGKQGRIEGPNRPLLESPREALPAPQEQIEGPRKQIEGPRDALPAPQRLLEGPQSPTDEMIDQTITQEDIDRVFADRVEGRDNTQRPGPNRFSDAAAEIDDPIEQAIRAWQDGDIDTAVRILRENKVPAQTLRDRLNSVTDAVGRAAGKAARGAL